MHLLRHFLALILLGFCSNGVLGQPLDSGYGEIVQVPMTGYPDRKQEVCGNESKTRRRNKLSDGTLFTQEKLKELLASHELWLQTADEKLAKEGEKRSGNQNHFLLGSPIRPVPIPFWVKDWGKKENENGWLTGLLASDWGADEGRLILKGAKLIGANLQEAELSGANLQGVELADANLKKTQMKYVSLQGADLVCANLQEANLWRANLQGVDLEYTSLQRADLSDADLEGVNLWEADLQGVTLDGANRKEAALGGATHLNSAKRANLEGALMSGADLQGADLWNSNLQGATLDRANLQGARLGYATLDWTEPTCRGRGWGTPPCKELSTNQSRAPCLIS